MRCALFLSFSVLCLLTNVHCIRSGHQRRKEQSLSMLDMAKESITRANDQLSRLAGCNPSSHVSVGCEEKNKTLFYLEVASKLISSVKENIRNETERPAPEVKPRRQYEKPMDCTEVMENGIKVSGIYPIWIGNPIPERFLHVYCDMDTEGGGWTVINRRGHNSRENFNREMYWYIRGFGNFSNDFWIGLDSIYTISNQAPYKIRFDLEDGNKNKVFAEYGSFGIEGANSYKLYIQGYKGNAGDAMANHNGDSFSTNERGEGDCTIRTQGGWWYDCFGRTGKNVFRPAAGKTYDSIHWETWKRNTALSKIEIKLKRVDMIEN